MHVTIKEQGVTGDQSTMCVSRETQTAIILQGDFDQLDQLVAIAASFKVPKVYLLVDPESVPTFAEAGWVLSDRVVIEKRTTKEVRAGN